MIPAIPFHFVRHGETDWSNTGRLRGLPVGTDIAIATLAHLQPVSESRPGWRIDILGAQS